MTNRLINRIRHSNPDLEFLPIEKIGRLKRGLSLEVTPLTNNDTLASFRNEVLMEAIDKIEKESENIRLENILYSRYLRRVESSKIVETFDEYDDESDVILTERSDTSNQTAVHAKLPEIARRLSAKKSSINSTAVPSWSKLVANWREHMYASFLLRVEKEKLSIAAYEIEQTKLDWERMKNNAQLEFDHYEVLLRAAESDVITEAAFNSDLEKNINKFHYNISERRFHNSRVIIPAELIIGRIKKRMHARLALIGLLHTDAARAQLRIRKIDAKEQIADDLRAKVAEIDINFVRTRKIDYSDTYEKLNRRYKIEKSSQYPILDRLQELNKILSEQEQEKIDYEHKYELLEHRLEKINNEIDSIKCENELIFKENNVLRNRIADIKKAPTITNYAHIIEQTKTLQHEIDIWTRRVHCAEVGLHILNKVYPGESFGQSDQPVLLGLNANSYSNKKIGLAHRIRWRVHNSDSQGFLSDGWIL